jgi:hypothetical protein
LVDVCVISIALLYQIISLCLISSISAYDMLLALMIFGEKGFKI